MQPTKIGLHASQDGDALRIQWNQRARPIVNADHAILYIADGRIQRSVVLSGPQLDSSRVRYWPAGERVSFRMDVYRGSLETSESTAAALSAERSTKLAGRAEVERLRPSPFERVQPEVVVVQYRRQSPVVRPQQVVESTEKRSGEDHSFDLISKIPLLRRLRQPQASDQNQSLPAPHD